MGYATKSLRGLRCRVPWQSQKMPCMCEALFTRHKETSHCSRMSRLKQGSRLHFVLLCYFLQSLSTWRLDCIVFGTSLSRCCGGGGRDSLGSRWSSI